MIFARKRRAPKLVIGSRCFSDWPSFTFFLSIFPFAIFKCNYISFFSLRIFRSFHLFISPYLGGLGVVHYPALSITFCCTVVANLGRQVPLSHLHPQPDLHSAPFHFPGLSVPVSWRLFKCQLKSHKFSLNDFCLPQFRLPVLLTLATFGSDMGKMAKTNGQEELQLAVGLEDGLN